MKRHAAFFLLLISLLCSCGILDAAVVADFDTAKPIPFQFKDEYGTLFNASSSYNESGRGRYLGLKYDIAPKGWAGWGISLNGADISKNEYLVFYVKGAAGDEKFQIGLKDKAGKEKKIESSSYFDVTTSWQRIKIPLSSFNEIDLQKVDSFHIGFNQDHGKGSLFVDDIAFEGTALNAEKAQLQQPTQSYTGTAAQAPVQQQTTQQPAAPSEGGSQRSNKVLIDGFERINPFNFYVVRTGGSSSLELASSRQLHDGDYSMEMAYALASDNPWGTWVEAHRDTSNNPLDWTGVTELRIWIKGDGTDNVFRINIVDADGETWSYESLNVLKNTKWVELVAPINEFRLTADQRANNGKLDLKKIVAYDLGIMSKSSIGTSGKIYVDQFVAVGMDISVGAATTPAVVEKLRVAVPSAGNIDFSASIFNEYFWCPEESRRLTHTAKLIANGKVGDFSGRIEYASESQNFGDAAALNFTGDSSSRTVVQIQNPKVISPSVQVMGNNLYPWLTNFTIGNIWFDYSKYTFSLPVLGGWGWKGATIEGDINRFNYHAFYINQPFDSYVIGTRWIAYWPMWKFVIIGVHAYESAKSETAQVQAGGHLTSTKTLEIKPISRDTVYNLEVWRWLLERQLQLQFIAGWNEFDRYGTADYSDVYHPVYNGELPETQKLWDPMYRFNAETNGLFYPGLQLAAGYRYVGTEYRPRFRQEPMWFDDADCDQKGYNVRVTQRYSGFVGSVEYDDLTRLSSSQYYRYRTVFGVGYYGFSGLDLALNYERRRERYVMTSDRSPFSVDKNELLGISEIYARSQLNAQIAIWFKIHIEDIEHPSDGAKYQTSSLFTKFEYYLSSNAKLFAEYKTTRYPEPPWEPKGYPFDDNYAKITFELTF